MTGVENSNALEVLARRRLELTAQRDQLQQSIDEVDPAILTLAKPGDRLDIDGHPTFAVWAGNAKWSEVKAVDVLPPEVVNQITVTESHVDPETGERHPRPGFVPGVYGAGPAVRGPGVVVTRPCLSCPVCRGPLLLRVAGTDIGDATYRTIEAVCGTCGAIWDADGRPTVGQAAHP